jgi:putative transposase
MSHFRRAVGAAVVLNAAIAVGEAVAGVKTHSLSPHCPKIQPTGGGRITVWVRCPPLLSFFLMIAAGWVHRHQLIVIEFLQAENRLLKARLRGRRIRFTDAERALLARKAKAVGRKALLELDTIVSPDTLLRWHRRLVAQKWNFVERRRLGRPGNISELIERMAQENPRWGYTRIRGALANLDHKVGRGTIANVLKRSGIEPAPERGRRTRWSTFLKAHWKVLAASDFLTVEVWTGRGLVTHCLLL